MRLPESGPDHRPRRSDDEPGTDFTGIRTVPVWLRPWVTLLNLFGVPTVLVIFFLAQDAGYIPSRSRDMLTAIQSHDRLMEERDNRKLVIDKALSEALNGIHAEMKSSNRIMRAVCAETKDPDVRRACLAY